MTLTVADLFPEDKAVRVRLEWGARRESAEQVAARILPMLDLFRGRFDAAESEWHGRALVFRDAADFTDPSALGRAIASNRERDAPDSPFSTGTSKTQFRLYADKDAKEPLFSLDVTAGRNLGPGPNEISLLLPAGFTIGTPDEASAWFRKLVRIWEPETGSLTSWEVYDTVSERRARLGLPGHTSYREPAVGYLNWFSRTAYGRLPFPVAGAAVQNYPDGTLITVRDWHTAAVADLYADLQVMGMMHDMPPVQVLSPPVRDGREPDTDVKENHGGN
ncbi:hypothetical protein [Arthrobacter sp. zg-Y1110]|uniref:hypothetical protein n=1 Tax=Arthrobacter sp. zg-Y1110 TaxID=2886932 RepID=UPI001D141522|nr:hypothetical protein [Arthrobacter sp. zg-Y1110]MCC3291357.1 hypothetical protein [Arthrobacter sp. zg-Y1110]UWX83776.1 hypothetical protein N2K99_09640 [Arthrobacter sp. zg-Y1110]